MRKRTRKVFEQETVGVKLEKEPEKFSSNRKEAASADETRVDFAARLHDSRAARSPDGIDVYKLL